jgi:hypothetical protein
MYAHLIAALLLLTVAPLAVRAEEPPAPPPPVDTATTPASAEQLPYGTGYEARQRAAQGDQQARSRDQTTAQERTRTEAGVTPAENRAARRDTDRAAAQREARRDSRERPGHHGGTGN